jgi:two-component system, OmpR family, sensor histidine kinase KdpD
MAEAPGDRRERLKIFLGYASGVGKSFRMFDEARRRRERGQDVVVGALQPHRSPEIDEILKSLEVIPPIVIDGVAVVDVETILRRHPRVCVIDGLAYDNPPTARHPYRWQDAQELVDRGIAVIASVNLQYIEEEQERVEAITGKHVTQTIPKAFLYGADEIVVVDVPPESIAGRVAEAGGSEEGVALRLSTLRELALLLTADIVDRQLETYLEARGMDQLWGAHERILVCVTPRTNADRMIAAAKRWAERFHGELHAAYVEQPELSPRDRLALDANLASAREAGAKVAMLGGEDFVGAIVDYARSQRITQILIGHSLRHSWWNRLRGGPIDRLIRAAEGMDLRVFPH